MLRKQRWAGLLLVVAYLTACSRPVPSVPSNTPSPVVQPTVDTATSVATAVPTPSGEEQRVLAIQKLFDAYAQMIVSDNWSELSSIADQRDRAFVRLLRDRGAYWRERVPGPAAFNVLSVSEQVQPYFRIHFRYIPTGEVGDMSAIAVENGWRFAEPPADELGEKLEQQTTSGLTVQHYSSTPVDMQNEINGVVDRAFERARTRMNATLDKRPRLVLKPIFDLPPLDSAGVLAYYDGGSRSKDRVVIYQPGSFAFGLYDDEAGWQPWLEQVLTHEFAHFIQDNDVAFVPLAPLPDWMTEGLAEYVAEHPRPDLVRAAVEQQTVLPIVDQAHPNKPRDLMHLSLLNGVDRSLAYGLSYSLVDYIVETYGGLDGFWKLARAYQASTNIDTALQKSLGVDLQVFEEGWHTWLQSNAGNS